MTDDQIGAAILAMSCHTQGCRNQVAFCVFWPGQTGFMCGPCCARAVLLASTMGFDLDFHLLTVAWLRGFLASQIEPVAVAIVERPGDKQDEQNQQHDPEGRPPVKAEGPAAGVRPEAPGRGHHEKNDQ